MHIFLQQMQGIKIELLLLSANREYQLNIGSA